MGFFDEREGSLVCLLPVPFAIITVLTGGSNKNFCADKVIIHSNNVQAEYRALSDKYNETTSRQTIGTQTPLSSTRIKVNLIHTSVVPVKVRQHGIQAHNTLCQNFAKAGMFSGSIWDDILDLEKHFKEKCWHLTFKKFEKVLGKNLKNQENNFRKSRRKCLGIFEKTLVNLKKV